MASSRSLGTLTLDLIAKLAGFEQGMDQAARKTDATARQIERRANQMQDSIEGAFKKAAVGAGIAIGGLTAIVGKSIDAMYDLVTLSKQVAMPIDQFTGYAAVAKNAEVQTEDFGTAMRTLLRNLQNAQLGSTRMVAFFKALDIDPSKIKTGSQALEAMADAFHKYQDDANKAAIATQLMGRSGAAMIPFLNEGSAALKEQAQHMKDLGVAFDQEGANKLSQFDDLMDEFHNTVQGLANTLALDLLPTINDALKGVTDFIQSFKGKEIIADFAAVVKTLASNLDLIAVFFSARFVAARAVAFFAAISSGANVAAGTVAGLRVALSLLGGPVGIAATAIALLATAVYKQQHQMSEAEKSAKDLRKAIDELKGADGAAVGPAIQHAEAVKKIAVANLAAAQAALTRLIAEKQAADESAKRLQGASTMMGGRADSRMGASYAQTWSSVTQGNIDKKKKDIEELQKAIQDAQKAIDKIELGVPDPKGATGGKPSIKLFDPAAAGKAKQQADALAKAVAALYAEVQNVNSTDDPSAKIEQDYANRIRHVAELGAAVIKAGGNVQQVQEQVAKAAQKLNQQMDFALDAPKRAMQEYQAGLDAQLKARQNEIDLQVQSIGLGDKEAAQLQELTKIRQDAAAAISKFTLQHQLHPDAMTDEQFQSQLKALKEYWEDYYNITADGQKRVDKAQASWQNGVQKSIDNFMDGMRNGAQQGQQFMDSFISGIGDAFVQFATGAESAKKAFGSFIDQLFADALRFVANKAIQALFDTLGAGSKQDAGTSPGWGNLFSNLLTVFGGGRAGGGLVAAGTMYRVNEGFGPEMLSVGGRDYLMMGAQAGYVTPAAQTARTTRGNTSINVMVQPTTTRRTADQVATAVARQQRIATSRNG